MKRRAQGQVFATSGLVQGVTAANAFRYLEVLSDLVSWRQRHPIALRLLPACRSCNRDRCQGLRFLITNLTGQ
jgi:hypothetical protein